MVGNARTKMPINTNTPTKTLIDFFIVRASLKFVIGVDEGHQPKGLLEKLIAQ